MFSRVGSVSLKCLNCVVNPPLISAYASATERWCLIVAATAWVLIARSVLARVTGSS